LGRWEYPAFLALPVAAVALIDAGRLVAGVSAARAPVRTRGATA
jgi:hypothetical protein